MYLICRLTSKLKSFFYSFVKIPSVKHGIANECVALTKLLTFKFIKYSVSYNKFDSTGTCSIKVMSFS